MLFSTVARWTCTKKSRPLSNKSNLFPPPTNSCTYIYIWKQRCSNYLAFFCYNGTFPWYRNELTRFWRNFEHSLHFEQKQISIVVILSYQQFSHHEKILWASPFPEIVPHIKLSSAVYSWESHYILPCAKKWFCLT